jgi:DNA-binding transcriptional regulator YdaS (Cro superfamily)
LSTEEYRGLIRQLRTWCKSERGRQKELANRLEVSPQLISDWLSGHRTVGPDEWPRIEWIIQSTEPQFLKDKPMSLTRVDPPTMPRPSVRDVSEPKTLLQAKEQLAAARQTIAQLQSQRAAGPTPNPAPARAPPFDPASVPGFKPTWERQRPEPPKQLPESAITPVLIQKLLDVTSTPDLSSMLGFVGHSPLQRGMIYGEIKKRRSMESGNL